MYCAPEAVRLELKRNNNFKCQLCGKECQNGHAHHISRQVENVHDISNLMYLCRPCHQLQHPSQHCKNDRMYFFLKEDELIQLKNRIGRGNKKDFAKKVGLSYCTLTRKLNGFIKWNASELSKINEIFDQH